MLEIHFLNVGHGDCTIIRHPSGRLTMLDINNGQRLDPVTLAEEQAERTALLKANPYSMGAIAPPFRADLEDPIAYLDRHFRGQPIHRYVQTHPDLDHMRGLARLLRTTPVLNFWHPTSTKVAPNFLSDEDEQDWTAYDGLKRGLYPTIKAVTPIADELGVFWNQGTGLLDEGDGIEILSPTRELVRWCNERGESNNISFVLSIAYAGRRVTLGGDAETVAWDHMTQRYATSLRFWLLKASHHGRDSGFNLRALQLMNPNAVILSVGKKPETDAHQRYRQYDASVLSTRRHGTIIVRIRRDGTFDFRKPDA